MFVICLELIGFIKCINYLFAYIFIHNSFNYITQTTILSNKPTTFCFEKSLNPFLREKEYSDEKENKSKSKNPLIFIGFSNGEIGIYDYMKEMNYYEEITRFKGFSEIDEEITSIDVAPKMELRNEFYFGISTKSRSKAKILKLEYDSNEMKNKRIKNIKEICEVGREEGKV